MKKPRLSGAGYPLTEVCRAPGNYISISPDMREGQPARRLGWNPSNWYPGTWLRIFGDYAGIASQPTMIDLVDLVDFIDAEIYTSLNLAGGHMTTTNIS